MGITRTSTKETRPTTSSTLASAALGVGAINNANMFAAGVVDSTALGTGSVAAIDVAASILPWDTTIRCTKPAVLEILGSGPVNKAVTITSVGVRCGTVPTGATDAFSLNVQVNGLDIFATDLVFAREPDVTGFLKTLDISGNDGTTFTSYLTEVTGAGTAALGGVSTLAAGDAIYVGFSQAFDGIRVDMDGANVNAQAATLAAHFWDGTAWTAVTTLVDGTDAAGATLAQDGIIAFETPVKWARKTINASLLFWIRLTHNGAGALTAGTAIDNCDVKRAADINYTYTPDQNLTVAAGALITVECAEADANADKLEVQLFGVVTTGV